MLWGYRCLYPRFLPAISHSTVDQSPQAVAEREYLSQCQRTYSILWWSLSLFPEFFLQRCPQPLQNSHFNIQQNILPLFLCGRHSTITHTHVVSPYGSKLSPRAQTKLQKNRSHRSKQHTPELTQLKHSSTVPTQVQATIISHLQIAIARYPCPYQLFSPSGHSGPLKMLVRPCHSLAQNPPLTSLSLRIKPELDFTTFRAVLKCHLNDEASANHPYCFPTPSIPCFPFSSPLALTPYHYYYFTYNVMFLLLPLRDVSHPSWTKVGV